jgi:ribosomal protein L7/L12
MQPIDFIVAYLRENATTQEIIKVAAIVNAKQYKHPPLEESVVLERIAIKCVQLMSPVGEIKDGYRKLNCVKYIKDVTGWGLKESKDWFDNVVENKQQ